MPERLLRVLEDCGVTLSPQELLDILWLALRLPQGADAPLAHTIVGAPASPDPTTDNTPPSPRPLPDAPPPEPSDPQPNQAYASPERTPPSTTGAAAGSSPARPIRLPEERAFPIGDLSLTRALRPLKQRRTHGESTELDEDATVAAYAGSGLLEMVMRPAQRRWLDLVLVVDDGLSMLLWRRLASELRALFERLGAFRDVRVYGLTSRGPDAPYLSARPFQQAARLSPAVVQDVSGRTLTLVISDGIGDAWHDGRLHATLASWATRGPTAVVHALPQRLWASTGLRAEQWKITSSSPGAANRSWRVDDPVLPPGLIEFDGLPVPLLELGPGRTSVKAWARLIASTRANATLPLLTPPIAPVTPDVPTPEPPPNPSSNTGNGAVPAAGTGAAAAAAVMHFRDAASPQAYQLAAHLAAVAPATVAVMRLVQAALPVTTAHLAEVFLGGLMRPVDESQPVELRSFDFDEAARQILLDTIPIAQLEATRRTVGKRIMELAGHAGTFPAWVPHPLGHESLPIAGAPFATLTTRQPAKPTAPTPDPTEAVQPVQSLPHPRVALMIATGHYADESLPDLSSTYEQADALARVLRDPRIGDFDEVVMLADPTIQDLRVQIEEFLNARGRDDLVVIHISGHALLDTQGRPYFAASDTVPVRLALTGLGVQSLTDLLNGCLARQQLVILDCSFNDAFSRGRQDFDDISKIPHILQANRRGREVAASSRVIEYVFETEPYSDPSTGGSLLTNALIEGLRTGNADLDGDGLVSTSDIFGYSYDRITAEDIRQTPRRSWYGGERELILARRAQPTLTTPSSPTDDPSDPIEPSAHRVCVAIDIAQFTQRSGAAQQPRSHLYNLVALALRRVDIDFARLPVTDYTDGIFFTLPGDIRSDAVIGFIDAMKATMSHMRDPRGYVLHLRMALSSGPVEHATSGLAGAAVEHSARLLESTELSEALVGNPVANLAIAISDSLFRNLIIRAGIASVLYDFRSTHIELREKGFSTEAWIYPRNTTTSVEGELVDLVGMNPFKEHLRVLRPVIAAQVDGRGADLALMPTQLHSLFIGNPGTGKTTAARILGRMLYSEGVLRTSRITEVTARDLLGFYAGQTVPRTAAAVSSALDGILLINDVGRLADASARTFNTEAVMALLNEMESHRGRLVVVLADTPQGMAKFLNSNPIARERFPYTVKFPDLSTEELMRIADKVIENRGLNFLDESIELLGEIVSGIHGDHGADFTNAWTIRSLVESIAAAWFARIGNANPSAPVTPEDLRSLRR